MPNDLYCLIPCLALDILYECSETFLYWQGIWIQVELLLFKYILTWQMHEDILDLNLPVISTDPASASYLENYSPLYYADRFLRGMCSLCLPANLTEWRAYISSAVPASFFCKSQTLFTAPSKPARILNLFFFLINTIPTGRQAVFHGWWIYFALACQTENNRD